MANQIAIHVYEFSTGLDWTGRRELQGIIREQIVDYKPHVIYNYQGTHFSGVRSKIAVLQAGVEKEFYVAETVTQIKALLDA